jgi:hypothetical protein
MAVRADRYFRRSFPPLSSLFFFSLWAFFEYRLIHVFLPFLITQIEMYNSVSTSRRIGGISNYTAVRIEKPPYSQFRRLFKASRPAGISNYTAVRIEKLSGSQLVQVLQITTRL